MYDELLVLSPVMLIGVICGIANFLNMNIPKGIISFKGRVLLFLKKVFNSSILCTIVYSILTAFEIPYLAKVGIAAAVTFLGLRTALDVIRELFSSVRRNPYE